MKIYLSGSIKKVGEYGEDDYWNDQDKTTIRESLSPITLQFLDPNIRSDRLEDPFSTFGRDILQVSSAQLVFVDARNKRGLGVGAEMAVAKMRQIPVIALVPPNSHYRRNEVVILNQTLETWVHPFVFSLSDFLASSIEEACCWIKSELLTGRAHIRGPECFDEAMSHYLNTQAHHEPDMQKILAAF
jgi:hypothetical protein